MALLENELDAIDLESLECKNEESIILGFMDRYAVSYEEAEEIFEETKK
ncbi:MAG: hypothetical protein RIB63_05175 [Fulvivirga sp.]